MEDVVSKTTLKDNAQAAMKLVLDSLKPRGKLLTPFNIVTGIILAVGFVLTIRRFFWGIGSVTNLNDNYPWGFWIGFDVMTGVALAAGGFVIGAAVHILGMKEYQSVIRPALLTGLLGYFFTVVGLLYDLGRPWRLPYPMVVSFGVTSVLFLIGWHFCLYLHTQFVEVLPVIFEWLGWGKLRKLALSLTVGATIFGITLATLHQAALGGLFLIAPWKLHPLWYSPYLPTYFFVSAVIAGMAMVIVEGMLSHRYFHDIMDRSHIEAHDRVTLGLAKGASLTMIAYFATKVIGVAYGNHWNLLFTPYGLWFLVEMLGFILLPCLMFGAGYRKKNLTMVRVAAVITVVGIFVNRMNVSIIAFNYHLPSSERYYPHWMEVWISVAIITAGIVVFRWMVTRMPFFYQHPNFDSGH